MSENLLTNDEKAVKRNAEDAAGAVHGGRVAGAEPVVAGAER